MVFSTIFETIEELFTWTLLNLARGHPHSKAINQAISFRRRERSQTILWTTKNRRYLLFLSFDIRYIHPGYQVTSFSCRETGRLVFSLPHAFSVLSAQSSTSLCPTPFNSFNWSYENIWRWRQSIILTLTLNKSNKIEPSLWAKICIEIRLPRSK